MCCLHVLLVRVTVLFMFWIICAILALPVRLSATASLSRRSQLPVIVKIIGGHIIFFKIRNVLVNWRKGVCVWTRKWRMIHNCNSSHNTCAQSTTDMCEGCHQALHLSPPLTNCQLPWKGQPSHPSTWHSLHVQKLSRRYVMKRTMCWSPDQCRRVRK